jgi:hypothetical protein
VFSRSRSNTVVMCSFSKWENAKILIGTSYSWFALDVRRPRSASCSCAHLVSQIAFYGLGLNNSIILSAIVRLIDSLPHARASNRDWLRNSVALRLT